MGLTTVFKSEVQDILVAVRLAADATAASLGSAPESHAFVQGYHSALEAVAAALGLELPSPAPRRISSEDWVRGPRVHPVPRLREYGPRDHDVSSPAAKASGY